jgi:hypothetical protein
MEAISEIKQCLYCAQKVIGRSDKKFCDDFCRNSFNNHLKGQINNVIRNVNGALNKNRRVLEELLPINIAHKFVPKDKLIKMGFRFKYHTHLIHNQKGQTYFFCYDYGIRETENQNIMIVRTYNVP